MRNHIFRLTAALAIVACTGDSAGNPSAPKADISTAYISVSPARPAAGSIATMIVRPGAGDPTLNSFAGRVVLPAGLTFVDARDAEDGALQAVRSSRHTVFLAAANPAGFAHDLFAFNIRVD